MSSTIPLANMAQPHRLEQHRYPFKTELTEDNLTEADLTKDCLATADTEKSNLKAKPVYNHSVYSHSSQIQQRTDDLAVEAAISVVINGIHYAVLMASPLQLKYLALGFLFSEGLIEHRLDLIDWEITKLSSADITDNLESLSESLGQQLQDYEVYIVELRLNQRCHQRILAQQRQLAGRTGCGMCGITGLTQALPDLSHYKTSSQNQPLPLNTTKTSRYPPKPSLDELLTTLKLITEAQKTHQLTGAVHGAATVYNGELHLFEDVGRHNALDKLIGWQLDQTRTQSGSQSSSDSQANKDKHASAQLDYVVMTSRLSIELVQKSIRAQIPWLIGMSAPTSTAVKIAERYGLGLAGFLRDNRVTFYTGFD